MRAQSLMPGREATAGHLSFAQVTLMTLLGMATRSPPPLQGGGQTLTLVTDMGPEHAPNS